MGFKLAVVVVSAYRHCPALGLLQTALYAGLQKTDEHSAGQTNIRLVLSRYPVGNKVIVPMPRENGRHHRKGARSESPRIKGEVFKARVLSVWKETRPHQKMRPTPSDTSKSLAELNSKRRGDVTEVRDHPRRRESATGWQGRRSGATVNLPSFLWASMYLRTAT